MVQNKFDVFFISDTCMYVRCSPEGLAPYWRDVICKIFPHNLPNWYCPLFCIYSTSSNTPYAELYYLNLRNPACWIVLVRKLANFCSVRQCSILPSFRTILSLIKYILCWYPWYVGILTYILIIICLEVVREENMLLQRQTICFPFSASWHGMEPVEEYHVLFKHMIRIKDLMLHAIIYWRDYVSSPLNN